MTDPYYADATVQLYAGDCLDILRELPDASIDAVVTDPPYSLTFMGRDWDRHETPAAFQAWCELWAAECLRVLKPGGHMLAFGGTRTFHRLACAVEDTGFEIRPALAWLFASGFPKSLNVGKAIDAKFCREAGTHDHEPGETCPPVPEGDPWRGFGTDTKPAFEPIVVARKPLVGTVAATVLAYGTGALNIDGCRIEGEPWKPVAPNNGGRSGGVMGAPREHPGGEPHAAGRWPANVVLDESQAASLDQQSGERAGSRTASPGNESGEPSKSGVPFVGGKITSTYDDQGGASRFFFTPKAASDERVRVAGVAHPTVKPLALMRWLVRLVTPPGGVVLEPFAGSGTTVEACILEGFRCIAVEREADYLPLIVQRINRRRDPVAAVRDAGGDGGLFDLLEGDIA